MQVLTENVPDELIKRDQWVCWRYETKPGCAKPAKMPCNAITRSHASSTNKHDYESFRNACHRLELDKDDTSIYRCTGIGFVFTPEDPYCGIDLDRMRDPASGVLTPLATAIARESGTYCEISPSSTGFKLWGLGKLPEGIKKLSTPLADGSALELFSYEQFFTATGHKLPSAPRAVVNIQPVIDQLVAAYFQKQLQAPRTEHKPVVKGDYRTSVANVEAYLSRRGIRYKRREYKDGCKIQCDCLFNPLHKSPDAAFFVLGSGAFSYKCLHASCFGRGWHEVKARFGKMVSR